MEPFRNLFQPIQVGKLELKNRIVMLAMTTGYGESDETVSDRLVTFFAERAGGVVGCETAEFLLEQGKGITRVTVLEMLDRMANDMSPTYRPFFLARLKKAGIRMITGAKVEEITGKGVRVSRADGPAWIEGNAVVWAGGSVANRQLVEELKGMVPEVHVAGDCISPRMIKEAMEEGFLAGWKI